MKRAIEAKLLLASKNTVTGDILYTWTLRYPRSILAEFNTHRVFSRNTASSRAIPGAKLRSQAWQDPFVPLHIGSKAKGMQAGSELSGIKRWFAEQVWRAARVPAIATSWGMEKLGVHKQVINRLTEPWMWVEQVASATEVDNFFLQRTHKDAEPHFQDLAKQMQRQVTWVKDLSNDYTYNASVDEGVTRYQWLIPGWWHLPFITLEEEDTLPLETQKRVSAARCARVSYLLPETGKLSTIDRDLELFNRLAGSNPKHLSPFEHQATPIETSTFVGNFRGWKQFRKEIPGEDGRQSTTTSTPAAGLNAF